MEVVLLGPTGFVGRALLARLLSLSEVTRVHALVRGSAARLVCHPKLNVVSGSLPEIPDDLIPQDSPHVVIHFATLQRCESDVEYSLNRKGMVRLLECCNANTRGIVYGSSLSVLGQGEQREVLPNATVCPGTPLARSRAETEEYLRREATVRGFRWAILRPRFVIDAQDPQTLGAWMKLARAGIWFGSGKQSFSIISLQDYVDVILGVARRLDAGDMDSQVLGVGYRSSLSYAEMVTTLREVQHIPGRMRIWIPSFTSKILRFLNVGQQLATRCELMGFHHSVNVDSLQQFVGAKVINKNPRLVLEELARQALGASEGSQNS
jgi:nucleoside-diphosphate-sugar epimerase